MTFKALGQIVVAEERIYVQLPFGVKGVRV